jgi:hypothetical protein
VAESAVLEPEVTSASEFLRTHKENHCPFHCKDEELDEYGYCYHLIGFSNDKKTLEPRKPLIRLDKDRVPYDTGFQTVLGGKKKQAVEVGDKFVNPEFPQVDRGITSTAKRWASYRVYRDIPKPPERVALSAANPADDEIYALAQKKRELEDKLARKRLRDEIAAMEKELGDPDDDDEDDGVPVRVNNPGGTQPTIEPIK